MKNKSIEVAIIDQVSKNELLKIGEGISEAVLDSFLEEDFLKNLPGFGFLISGYNLQKNVREKLFAKKVLRFLYTLREIPHQKRVNFIKKIDQEPDFKRKVGETIVLFLDQMDDMDKSTISGLFFKAYIEENINFVDLKRLLSALASISIEDLQHLKDYVDRKTILRNDLAGKFVANGLVKFSIQIGMEEKKRPNPRPSIYYNTLTLGISMVQYAFPKD